MRVYKWLWISALMFFGASAISLYDYRNSIDGPSNFWDAASLVGVSARPIHAECRPFTKLDAFKETGNLADPQVKFSYVYERIEFLGARYSRTHKYRAITASECKWEIQNFLASQSMTVWVDPKNPSYAVFKKDPPFPLIELSFLLTGLVLAIVGCLTFAKSRMQ